MFILFAIQCLESKHIFVHKLLIFNDRIPMPLAVLVIVNMLMVDEPNYRLKYY